jgi:predicted N-formylglutamate amidohydrolase
LDKAVRTDSDDPSGDGAVDIANPSGRGDFVFVCEHASNFIPADLGALGLDDDALQSHIAWDPGALAVASTMAEALDAPLVAPRMSRLVYDCNRSLDTPSAVPEVSEAFVIPGNAGLSPADRKARAERVYTPFRDALNATLDERMDEGRRPVLVSIHSFTPVYNGVVRDMELGILHGTDTRFADALLAAAGSRSDLEVRRNEPYGPEDGVAFTLSEHAIRRGLLNAMIEIRNDLIADGAAQQAMAERLSGYVTEACRRTLPKSRMARHA